MTNKEAIEILEILKANYSDACLERLRQACDMAIYALGADNNVGSKGDMIYRQDAIHVVNGLDSSFVKYIEELPPAQPEPCEDCVSRKAVIRLLHSGYHSKSMIEEVKELPSAQPEHKTGKWILDWKHNKATCSECHRSFYDVFDIENYDNFCRGCGAKMESAVKRNVNANT